jgi:hypothetical protein
LEIIDITSKQIYNTKTKRKKKCGKNDFLSVILQKRIRTKKKATYLVLYESAGHFDVLLDVQRPRTSAQHLAHDPRLREAPRRLALRRTRYSAKPRPEFCREDDQPQRRQGRHLQLERGMLGSFGVDRMPRGASQRHFPFKVGSYRYVAQVRIRSARALSNAVLTEALVPTTEVGALHSNDLGRHFSHFFNNHFVPNAEK